MMPLNLPLQCVRFLAMIFTLKLQELALGTRCKFRKIFLTLQKISLCQFVRGMKSTLKTQRILKHMMY